MAKVKPTCNKCGNVHFNFQPCQLRQMTPAVQLRRPRMSDWGDRIQSRVVIANGVYGNRRKPLHSEPRFREAP